MRMMRVATILVFAALFVAGFGWGDGVQQAKVPVAGAYMEPALGGPVAYVGEIIFYWTPGTDAAGRPVWNHTAVLQGEAWSLANGVKFKIYSVCQNCLDAAHEGTVTMVDPFWAVGVPGPEIPAFEGSLTVTLQVPIDATLPAVSGVALAMK
jgi:hypothetical protein